ncbi:MAG: site-2 protease family protein, partial [Mucinivorans sp.]
HKSDTVQLTFVRQGQTITAAVPLNEQGKMGAYLGGSGAIYPISTRQYNVIEAVPAGVQRGLDEVSNYLKQLKVIASPETGAYKEVGGFIAIGKIFPAAWSWFSFWNITALLSIMLAVINILPIPALDGGHLVFILYEMITRRAPSQKFMEAAQYVGFILILGLLIFANGNDIIKLFTGN